MSLPPKVTIKPWQNIKDYWVARATQHLKDSYMGVPMMKFPEDLRVYEHLLHVSGANVVVELGSYHGGSALWFRDRLRSLSHYRGDGAAASEEHGTYHVVTVDLYPERARGQLAAVDPHYSDAITVLQGDVTTAAAVEKVRKILSKTPRARPLIIEDSEHTYDTTLQALRRFAPLVPPDGFYVVEDGYLNVDDYAFLPRSRRREVIPAVRDYLLADPAFQLCREYELYGITSHPEGILRRVPS